MEPHQFVLRGHEIVTLAVHLVGGDRHPADTEDVAVKANQLAPGRFTWRKYKDQINIEIIRAFLSDAKKEKYGALLSGSGNTGWLLTDAGVMFVKENMTRLAVPLVVDDRLNPNERQRRRAELARIIASDAFRKFEAGQKDQISKRDAEKVFRLNDYIAGIARSEKVQRILNAHGNDEGVGAAIQYCADVVLSTEDEENGEG